MKTSLNNVELSRDAFELKGWRGIPVMAKAAAQALRRWRVPVTSKTGRRLMVRYPRVEVLTKSKLGRMATTLSPNREDMASLQKRLTPESFDVFRTNFRSMVHGIEHTIESISLVTCQATGRLGARQVLEIGGWIRTLHPSVSRKLEIEQKPLRSWCL